MRVPILVAVAAAALALQASGATAAPSEPWLAYQQLDQALFDAQLAVTEGEQANARAALARATGAAESLGARLPPRNARNVNDLTRSVDAVSAAVEARSETGVAVAVARSETLALSAAFEATLAAAARGDAADAQRWLLVRGFEHVTRYTHPGATASVAVASLRDGVVSPQRAARAIRLDLLGTYESLLRSALADSSESARTALLGRSAQAAASAQGYWRIIRAAYAGQRGEAAAESLDRSFAHLVAAASSGETDRIAAFSTRTRDHLSTFRAAPLVAAEQRRRAGQLVRFLGLVPIEYRRGVAEGRVTVPIEIQEAITFRDGAAEAFGDLQSYLARSDPAATRAAQSSLDDLQRLLADTEHGTAIADPDAVDEAAKTALAKLDSTYPDEWKGDNTQADFDVIAALLQKVSAAAATGDYRRAESSRLEAYATFELGPEQHLRGLAPTLFQRVEGLFWYGADSNDGLAQLIRRNSSGDEIAATLAALDLSLKESAEAIGEGASRPTVIANTAIITFREGLEAVLILAALMASMVGPQRRFRRPLLVGAALALAASAVTWVVAQTILESLAKYGERVEVIVSLVAIGVLLLILNWFYHRVYWQENLQDLHRKKKSILAGAGLSLAAAQVAGLVLLGFTSVYREGFETTLFVQALTMEAGALTVLQGVAIGLAATLAVGFLVVSLERKLPHKKMLIVTGVLITWVLVILVGQTVQLIQKVGWLPVAPIAGLHLPYWSGLWLGLYPTWQGLPAQAGAAAFVVGSYLAAEAIRKRRRQRRLTPAPAAVSADRGMPKTR